MKILAFVILIGLWGLVAPVSAQTPVAAPPATARTHFDSGTIAFNEARWADCAADYERSFALSFAPGLLYNIGLCYHKLSVTLPDSEARDTIERAIAAYRRFLRETPGNPRGRGNATDTDRVLSTILDLQTRLSRLSTVTATESTVTEPAVPQVEATAPPDTGVSLTDVPRGRYPFTIAGGALTLVSVAIAIGLGLHAQTLKDEYENYCENQVSIDQSCLDDAGGRERYDSAYSYTLGANLMWVVSGLALAGTTVGFALEFTATDAVPSRASLTVSGRF